MEDWKMVVFWLALGINLAVGAWNLAVAVRREWSAECLEHETYKKRPLLSDDKVAVMRPGDTVLLMPSLDDMTVDQQTMLVGAIKRMSERANALGIEFVVIPDWGGQKTKAIVVSRSDLSKHADNGGHDSDDGSKGSPEDKQAG